MKAKTNLANRIQLYIFLSIVFVASIFMFADILTESIEYNSKAEEIRIDFYQQQQDIIKNRVEEVYNTVIEEKSKMNQQILETTKPLVEQAYNVATSIYSKYKDKKPDVEIQELIKDALRPVKFFEGRQYYFILDMDSNPVMLNNQQAITAAQLANNPNLKGNSTLDEMVTLIREKNEGFYTYYWSKPGAEGDNHKKSSYIKLFEPYNWIIGTGVYYEDYEEKLKKDLLEKIGKIRYGKNDNGYIFVFKFDGTTLMNDAQKKFIGKNIWDLEDINGRKVIQEQIKVARKPEGGFSYYSWNNPATGKMSKKISYVKGIQDWEWMIGAGFYIDDIEPEINALHDTIYNDRIQEFIEYFLIVSAICLILILFRKIFTRRLEKDLRTLIDFFKEAAKEDKLIETDKIRYQEFDELAEYANEMLEERITAKNNLEKLNSELTERVKSEISKNEKHVQLLHEQKKHADMGQMINAIAHQWRQPLNNIHLITQMMSDLDKGHKYSLSKDTLYKQHGELVDHMSRTIDDFRNYFSVRKVKHEFSIKEEIGKTVDLIQAQLNSKNISIELIYNNGSGDEENNDIFNGFSGEFRQIIMNLLSNAKDAIEDKRIKEKKSEEEHIKIYVETNENEITIKLFNSGDKIPDDILSKIFNPYFTTKDEGEGTGIGLYITKTIIENEMNGTISVLNEDNGVTFTIIIRK